MAHTAYYHPTGTQIRLFSYLVDCTFHPPLFDPPFIFLDLYITCCRLNWIIYSIYYNDVHISKWPKQWIANIIPIERTQISLIWTFEIGGTWWETLIYWLPRLFPNSLIPKSGSKYWFRDQNTDSETMWSHWFQATTTCQETGRHWFSDPPTACSLNRCEYPQWFTESCYVWATICWSRQEVKAGGPVWPQGVLLI